MSRVRKAILLGFLVGIAGLIVSPLRFTLGIEENIGLGLLFRLRGACQVPRDAVVISIDRESSEQLNIPDNPDKWPRSLHERLTETLAREPAISSDFFRVCKKIIGHGAQERSRWGGDWTDTRQRDAITLAVAETL